MRHAPGSYRYNNIFNFVIIALAWPGIAAVAASCLSAAVPAGQTEPASHAERLAWQLESWDSIELRVRQELSSPADRMRGPQVSGVVADHFDFIDDHYIETAAGQRFQETLCEKSGNPASRSAEFFDGERGASLTYNRQDFESQQQVILHRHFGLEDRLAQVDKPRPLFFHWVGREPLHEALTNAQPQGESQVLGRACDVFLFSNVGLTGQQDHIYHLDKSTSVPLKVEFYRNPGDREANRPLILWTAKSLDTVQGYPIVRESVQLNYTGEDDTLSMTREYRVESVAFNKEFPKSTFWPEFQPGAVVFDTIANKSVYQVPGAEGATPSTPHAHAEPVSNAVRAEPPTPWSTYAASTSIALGLAILVTSLALWWRRG